MTEVLIVGGGPVGVMAGILLAQRGFSVQLFERHAAVYDLPRAIAVDAEGQRIFQNAGLLDQLLAITTPMAGAEFIKPDGEQIMGFEIPSGVDFPLGLHPTVAYYQPELESLLRRAAIDAGVVMHLGVTVDRVVQDAGGVRVEASDGESRTIHEGDWLVAADGASSPTRTGLGAEVTDLGFDQDWLVVDLELHDPVTDRGAALPRLAQQICDPSRPTTFVCGHRRYRRWEFQLQEGESVEEMGRDERVWELLRPWLTPDDARLVRAAVYRFHATVADEMRHGRVFLAGDAAHQMPPFLGQGLCSGFRDAANLSWKLQMVDAGHASDALLDTYGIERIPHATDLVEHAADTGRLIDQLSGRTDDGVGLEAGYGGSRPFPHLETGVRWGSDPSVGRQCFQPLVGSERLDHLLGSGFAVLVHEADVAADVAPRWQSIGGAVVVLPTELLADQLAGGGAVVVRPDRIVAAVTSTPSELVEATDALFALMSVIR